MEMPLLVCYTIDHAMGVLGEMGIRDIAITRTGACFRQGNNERVERVIGQRIKKGLVELIVS
ncbi:MAG TPA: hypothetical protein PK684_07450 [Bacillota bacterium]|nr:hypothetical protein [Bacillota bacterium]